MEICGYDPYINKRLREWVVRDRKMVVEMSGRAHILNDVASQMVTQYLSPTHFRLMMLGRHIQK